MLAAGCGDGAVRVFDAETGKLNYNLNIAAQALPTTALCWRPVTESSRTRNVLIAANADGAVQHWHVTSGRCLHEINDPNNSLFTIDYSSDGTKFATAGKDYAVRIYDEATKTMVSKMEGGYHAITKGHSNRIFSLKFDKSDDNIVVSGGWDNTIQIWDLRVERSIRSFFGPHICGDSIDISGGTILTGSYRMDNQLQTWDFGTGKLIDTISWGNSSTQLYAACFDPSSTLIGAGGSGKNEAKIFDRTAGNALVGTVAGLSRGVYSIDFNFDGSKFVVAGGDATVRLFSVQTRKT
jgi:WD40 repeat protein